MKTVRHDEQATAWDGTPLPPWPRGFEMLNPLAWIMCAAERDVLSEPPPGYGPGDQERVRAAGGLAVINARRVAYDRRGLRQRQDDQTRIAHLQGYGPQELRILEQIQRIEAEHIAYAEIEARQR